MSSTVNTPNNSYTTAVTATAAVSGTAAVSAGASTGSLLVSLVTIIRSTATPRQPQKEID
jgi:hypothetical protein